MTTIASDYIDDAKAHSIVCEEVSAERATLIHHGLLARYGGPGRGWPLWAWPHDFPSVQDERSWIRIGDFLAGKPCFLLWEPRSEKRMIRFRDGAALVPLLRQTYMTEFYVTDDAMSYLLCFNHHDYLIGAGAATEWVRSLGPAPGG